MPTHQEMMPVVVLEEEEHYADYETVGSVCFLAYVSSKDFDGTVLASA